MASPIDSAKVAMQLAPYLAPKMAGGALARVLDLAIEGYSKLPGAKHAAAEMLKQKDDVELAINALVNQHVALAGAQGFATNLGGFVTALVAIPANMAGAAVIQCRMVAGIAHLRGYDLGDNRVRSAVLMCLLGKTHTDELVKQGQLPSTPLGVATAPAFDENLDDKISSLVMNDILAAVSGKRLGVMLSKRIPVIGGGVGAAVDGYATHAIARHAKQQFPSRRKTRRD